MDPRGDKKFIKKFPNNFFSWRGLKVWYVKCRSHIQSRGTCCWIINAEVQWVWAEGWTNLASVQQSLNPLNTACLCSLLFREVAILGLYLSLSSPHLFSFHLCPARRTKGNLLPQKKSASLKELNNIFSRWQLNFALLWKLMWNAFSILIV